MNNDNVMFQLQCSPERFSTFFLFFCKITMARMICSYSENFYAREQFIKLHVRSLTWPMISSTEVLKQTGSPFKLSPSRRPSLKGEMSAFMKDSLESESMSIVQSMSEFLVVIFPSLLIVPKLNTWRGCTSNERCWNKCFQYGLFIQ